MRLGLSRRRRHTGRLGVLMFFALLIAGVTLILLVKLQPAFLDYAEKYADNIANTLVNNAVQTVYNDNRYSGLSEVNDGKVKTIETDTAKINRLKAELNQTIQNGMNESETVYIPLGSAIGFYFLSGIGPKIPIKICPVSVVGTDLRDEFSSAGINQVYHKIYLDVEVEMSFVGLLMSDTKTVATTALVSETVIIGDTPQYYGMGEIAVE